MEHDKETKAGTESAVTVGSVEQQLLDQYWAAKTPQEERAAWVKMQERGMVSEVAAVPGSEALASTTLAFPKHEGSMHLTHNDHLSYYKTVAKAVEDEDFGYTDWVNEEQKQAAITTNDCWFIQWYPSTPVGFCILAAADLDVLLKAACLSQ